MTQAGMPFVDIYPQICGYFRYMRNTFLSLWICGFSVDIFILHNLNEIFPIYLMISTKNLCLYTINIYFFIVLRGREYRILSISMIYINYNYYFLEILGPRYSSQVDVRGTLFTDEYYVGNQKSIRGDNNGINSTN